MTQNTTASMKEGTNEAPKPLARGTEMDERSLKRLVIDRMADCLEWLLRLSPSDGVRWTGTMTDLVEATHIVWLTGRVLAPDGRPMTFTDMMRRACQVLHRPMPCNSTSLLAHATQRKGVRSCSVLTRYAELLTRAKLQNPFLLDIAL